MRETDKVGSQNKPQKHYKNLNNIEVGEKISNNIKISP